MVNFDRSAFEKCRGGQVSSCVDKYFVYREGKVFWKMDKGVAKAGARAGRFIGFGRRQICINRVLIPEPHVIFYLNYSWWPCMIDHINRDPTDNRIENLRPCNATLNNANRTQHITGYKGISFYPKATYRPWRVYVGRDYVGYFATKSEAIQAYIGFAKNKYGEFATLGERK